VARGRQPRRRGRVPADVPAHHGQRRLPGLVRPPASGRRDIATASCPARLARGSARPGTAEEPHVAPQFLAAVDEYYKQLVPNAEAKHYLADLQDLHAV
jgi:hypothetical protein